MAANAERLQAFVRTLSPPSQDRDDELLRRFTATHDVDALDSLIRRYAGLVMGVCRRRFGRSADADDAFQSTFLVFAKQAGTVRHVPAWLHRVATLTCHKLAGRADRRGSAPMETDLPDPAFESHGAGPHAERREEKLLLDEELLKLPETHRAVIALCFFEGLSNRDAAERLGIPVGTVDSRLHSAKTRLRDRLSRRGISLAAIAVLLSPTIAPAVVPDELLRTTLTTAVGFALGEATAPTLVTNLSNEVISAMSTFKLKLFATAVMCLTLAGGSGLYLAQAGPQQKPDPAKTAKADPVKEKEKPVREGVLSPTLAPGTTAATTAVLLKPAELNGPIDMTLGDLLEQLSAMHNATFRAEQAWFREKGEPQIYDKKISIRMTKGLSVADILDEVAASLSQSDGEATVMKVGYRVKGNQVILGPKFIPASAPGGFAVGPDGPMLQIPQSDIVKMLYGPTVSLSVKNKTLDEVLDILREQTGANIVLNKTSAINIDQTLTMTLNDTKLFSVLKVIADQYDLAPATVDNVFYITSKSKADELNSETSRALFGSSEQPSVIVPVDKDGKFVPHRINEIGGGGSGTAFKLVPVQVDDKKPEKSKP